MSGLRCLLLPLPCSLTDQIAKAARAAPRTTVAGKPHCRKRPCLTTGTALIDQLVFGICVAGIGDKSEIMEEHSLKVASKSAWFVYHVVHGRRYRRKGETKSRTTHSPVERQTSKTCCGRKKSRSQVVGEIYCYTPINVRLWKRKTKGMTALHSRGRRDSTNGYLEGAAEEEKSESNPVESSRVAGPSGSRLSVHSPLNSSLVPDPAPNVYFGPHRPSQTISARRPSRWSTLSSLARLFATTASHFTYKKTLYIVLIGRPQPFTQPCCSAVPRAMAVLGHSMSRVYRSLAPSRWKWCRLFDAAALLARPPKTCPAAVSHVFTRYTRGRRTPDANQNSAESLFSCDTSIM